MGRPGDKSNFTDEQLKEWHQLVTRGERLNELLLEEQNKARILDAQLADARHALATAVDDFRADFDRMSAEIRNLSDQNLALRNRLALIGEWVPDLVTDFLMTFQPFTDAALTPEMVKRRNGATELLRLLEPFTT